jgi:hypothetical protein
MSAVNVSAAASAATLIDTRVAMLFEDGGCLLGNGMRAQRALSCLIEPQPGDRVLAGLCVDGIAHVLHVLAREPGGCAHLSVPGADALALRQRRVGIHALERVDIASAGDVAIAAAAGTLALEGRNLFATATDAIVQQAAHFVGKVGQYLLDARGLLRLHGEHALLTAERDVKVDAERISMG